MRTLNSLDLQNNTKPISYLLLFCIPLFLIYLADSCMSFIFPIVVESHVNSNTLLGFVMAASSLVGIICDFIFPQIFHNRTWKFYSITGAVLALGFPFATYLGDQYSLISIFLIASVLWGIYFELIGFAQQDFIIKEEDKGSFSKSWGIVFVIIQMTLIVGPILGASLLQSGELAYTSVNTAVQIMAIFFFILLALELPNSKKKKQVAQIEHTINLIKELKYWNVIGRSVFPIILTGVCLKFVEATYWTLGGLFGKDLSSNDSADWITIILYSVPLIIGSTILAKVVIKNHKKKFSQISLLAGGLLLIPIAFLENKVILLYAIIFFSSLFLSFAGPLNEAVYSDLMKRLGKNEAHLLGLDKSNSSLAYIIAPILSGFIADHSNYYLTFSFVGVLCAVCAIFLLITTPRKLKMPQSELNKIEELNSDNY